MRRGKASVAAALLFGLAAGCGRIGYEAVGGTGIAGGPGTGGIGGSNAGGRGGAVATGSGGNVGGVGGATAGGGGSQGGASGSGGSSAGRGGSSAGTGGASAGRGGASAGTGGASAGTGGASAGRGGSSAGTGGSSAGRGGSSAGTGGSSAGRGGVAGGSAGAGGGTGGASCTPQTFGGHNYVFCNLVPLSWTDAGSDCALKGMRLVRIDDAGENSWLQSVAFAGIASTSSIYWPWIGGTDQAVVGEWRWTDGALFWVGGSNGTAQGLYTNWVAGSPTSGGAATDCAFLQQSAYWADTQCTRIQPYFCEQY